MKVTADVLEKLGACSRGVEKFRSKHPKGLKLTYANARRAAREGFSVGSFGSYTTKRTCHEKQDRAFEALGFRPYRDFQKVKYELAWAKVIWQSIVSGGLTARARRLMEAADGGKR